ncbi:hypothetical protein HPP92_010047 [Vanilla planifolia]|uniref:Mitochondrial import inner membrane translocase subunit TIM50 n=1 Tax=Vanilla planifolia TaxID=51239 RepID=A0A835R8Z8_VANPL|nr:hypothetical protein HPP92_010047 [Vanilla planifolia]
MLNHQQSKQKWIHHAQVLGMEFVMASCPMNLEKIFSPGLEQNDGQFIPTIHTDSVEDEQPQLPHLVADEVDDKDCLSEFQAFSSFDFFFSDNLTTLPFDGGIGFGEIIYEDCPYELMNSDAMLDMAERCLLLPLLDNPVDIVGLNNGKCVGKHMVDSFDPCMYLTIHHLRSPDQELEQRCLQCNLEEKMCFNVQLPCSKLANSTASSSSSPPTVVEVEKRKAITLVLDLDETLVHSSLEHCDNADFSFPVFFDMKQHTVKLISQCFYRESCLFSEGSYTKDLTILGIDLAKVAIIDNSPQVFRLQVNNGIPIKSWFDDPTDQALNSLLPFLETLANVDDVRPLISARFGSKEERLCTLRSM